VLALLGAHILGADGTPPARKAMVSLAQDPVLGGREWFRSGGAQYLGQAFIRGENLIPSILMYVQDVYDDYTLVEFLGNHLLRSMELVKKHDIKLGELRKSKGIKSPWKPIHIMKSLEEVQGMVKGVLAFFTQYVLYEGCKTLGGSVDDPFTRHLQQREASRRNARLVPACMPAKVALQKKNKGGGEGWVVLDSGYISILLGYKPGEKLQACRTWVPVRELAHRLVCWAFRGPPLLESMECAHLCGCANCLAPLHLVWVTCHQNDKMREWHAAVPGRLGQMCPRRVWERA